MNNLSSPQKGIKNSTLFLVFAVFYFLLIALMISMVKMTHPKADEDSQNYCWELAVKREHAFAGTKYEQALQEYNQHCLDDISKTSPLGGE